ANIPAPASFDSTGPCIEITGGYSCPQAPCFQGVIPNLQQAFATLQENSACVSAALSAIDSARAAEGLGPMELPSNWSSLTVPEQVFVATNLERVDRGVPALVGMVASVNSDAQAGANAGADPALGQSYGSMASSASGAIWAGGELNPLLADYDWMYSDGYSGGPGGNIDCTSPSAPGCWGHRDIMLGAYTGTTCSTCVMGAGFATSAADGYHLSYTGVIVKPRTPVTSFVFTWAQEQALLPGANSAVVSPAPAAAGGASGSAGGTSDGGAVRVAGSLGAPAGMVGIQSSSDGGGYWITDSSGSVHSFGDAASATGAQPGTVGAAATPDGKGWWLASADGAVTDLGDAPSLGSAAGTTVAHPIVGIAATPDGGGYWLVASDGGIFSFGDASFYGSTGAERLNRPIVGMAATPDGHGYWLVASDGGIFAFGDATFAGSTGAERLSSPIVGMSATPDGHGYRLVASDGGIFAFGDAAFYGSTGAEHLNSPIVGMAATPDGGGYWLLGADGGVFSFGDAAFHGSAV
ncbi:MAG: hypothetical protein ACYCSJ_12420, partial [Acidimicrobiales bacterium]